MSSSNTAKELAFLALGVATGLSSILLYCKIKGESTHKKPQSPKHQKSKAAVGNYDTPQYIGLKQQQLVRTIQYFGKEKFRVLENSYVVIVGVGAVGSHVANIVARSGVRRIKLIDSSKITLNSLGKHSCATRESVGVSKTIFMKQYILSLLPHLEVECILQPLSKDNVAQLIPEDANYVIDCLSDAGLKTIVAERCLAKKIRLMVSGDYRKKYDITKLQIKDLSDSLNDRLLQQLRKNLTQLGFKKGINTVHSYQETISTLDPPKKSSAVLATMPAVLGMTIASYVLCDMAGEKYEPFVTEDLKTAAYHKLYTRLLSDQKKKINHGNQFDLDFEDVYFLVRHVYDWTCVITGEKEPKVGYLTRWEPRAKATLSNVVFMSKGAYDEHVKLHSLPESNYPNTVLILVAEKLALSQKLRAS